MGRMNSEERRQELIQIAYGQFLSKGYEKTSIRSIVGEAKGEIGMFYHYFASKDAIFEAVLESYNEKYLAKFHRLIELHQEQSFFELMDLLLYDVERSLSEYKLINEGNVNKEVIKKLHQSTLDQLAPIFADLVERYIQVGEITLPKAQLSVVTNFILYGISAVLHMQGEMESVEKHQEILSILKKLLA